MSATRAVVFHGHQPDTELENGGLYDAQSDQWTPIPSAGPVCPPSLAVGVALPRSGQIFTACRGGNGTLHDARVYDMSTNQWVTAPTDATSSLGALGTADPRYVYIYDKSKIHQLDTRTLDTWRSATVDSGLGGSQIFEALGGGALLYSMASKSGVFHRGGGAIEPVSGFPELPGETYTPIPISWAGPDYVVVAIKTAGFTWALARKP